MAAVVLQHVAKIYPDGIRAVDDLTLAVRDGAELPRDTSALRASSDSTAALVGRFGLDSAVREGEPVDAVVDTGRLHFFDPDTGRGIHAIDKEGAIT